ncbi:peptide ABC transporter permease [Pandoraea cepalis]|uniref:Peptide ABC transporter permease n=1 Tax=Pandoraea cepalis TaxID=2508294 RepID=A0AAW7MHN1_9BURK|nr:ABC transporter permease [Pandoraea cepalis]MDN4572263.1 peptide ABC transporter permease [Pandoraea cepalis]MDN4576870.1 peptide ABC transporter permease [Pandoraea cepalis]
MLTLKDCGTGRRDGKPRLATAVLRRAGASVMVLVAVSLLLFLSVNAMPGDPARILLGELATPQMIAHMHHTLGLDQPWPLRYLRWVLHLISGDFGTSYATRGAVSALLGPAVCNSLVLVAIAIVIALPLSVLLGALTATFRDSWLDHCADYVLLILSAIPDFAKSTLLVLLFATAVWQVLPAVAIIPAGDSLLDHGRELIMPVAVLALSAMPYLTRLVRASMIDALEAEYVQMSRLKGLRESRILFVHALPNAIVPLIQGTSLCFALMLGGAVMIEFVFRYPGIGALLNDAVSNRDMPTIQGVILVFSSIYMINNLLAELLVLLASPESRSHGL